MLDINLPSHLHDITRVLIVRQFLETRVWISKEIHQFGRITKRESSFVTNSSFGSSCCETFVHSVQWTSSDWLLASLPLFQGVDIYSKHIAFLCTYSICGASLRRNFISTHGLIQKDIVSDLLNVLITNLQNCQPNVSMLKLVESLTDLIRFCAILAKCVSRSLVSNLFNRMTCWNRVILQKTSA